MIKYKITTATQVIEFPSLELAQAWNTTNNQNLQIVEFSESAPTVNQFDLDKARFEKRAQVKDQIISEMAAENMSRVRSGLWTTNQLIGLTQDSELKSILDDISTLSYEIAYSKIDGLTNALLTSDIKSSWKAKLASHFYL